MEREIAFKAGWWNILCERFGDGSSRTLDVIRYVFDYLQHGVLPGAADPATRTAFDFIRADIDRERREEEERRRREKEAWRSGILVYRPAASEPENIEVNYCD